MRALLQPSAVAWHEARQRAYESGAAALLAPVEADLADCDGLVLAQDVVTRTDLPAFDCASVDGYAVRGPGPWLVSTATLAAGLVSAPLGRDGMAARIATGAMVPADAEAILRLEDARELAARRIDGRPRPREWRQRGEQARRGDLLVAAATTVTPAVLGLAASAGYERLSVRPRPRLTLVLLGDGAATAGLSGAGRIRDAIGPQIPAWARRLGLEVNALIGPVPDTQDAHREALTAALSSKADLIATTGGTMHAPTDHLRSTLAELGAEYLVETVRSRPGRPMLLARLPVAGRDGGVLLAGLPGRPQPAVLALLTLVASAAAGLTGRPLPPLRTVVTAEPIQGRGEETRLALVSLDADGRAHPVESTDSAALHGMVGTAGFAVVGPGRDAEAGERLPLLALPLTPALD